MVWRWAVAPCRRSRGAPPCSSLLPHLFGNPPDLVLCSKGAAIGRRGQHEQQGWSARGLRPSVHAGTTFKAGLLAGTPAHLGALSGWSRALRQGGICNLSVGPREITHGHMGTGTHAACPPTANPESSSSPAAYRLVRAISASLSGLNLSPPGLASTCAAMVLCRAGWWRGAYCGTRQRLG